METIPNIERLKKYTMIDAVSASADNIQKMLVEEF